MRSTMASRQANVFAGLVGVGAGLSAYLPNVICPGLPCSSCFACVGAGGAAASALVVGFVSRRFGGRCHLEGDDPEDPPKQGEAKEVSHHE